MFSSGELRNQDVMPIFMAFFTWFGGSLEAMKEGNSGGECLELLRRALTVACSLTSAQLDQDTLRVCCATIRAIQDMMAGMNLESGQYTQIVSFSWKDATPAPPLSSSSDTEEGLIVNAAGGARDMKLLIALVEQSRECVAILNDLGNLMFIEADIPIQGCFREAVRVLQSQDPIWKEGLKKILKAEAPK